MSEPTAIPLKPIRREASFWRRFWQHKPAMVGATLVLGFVLLAIWGLIQTLTSIEAGPVGEPYADPSLAHPLGLDYLGRDLFDRLARGAVTSLRISAMAVLLSLGIGVPFGILAGYIGGWFDLLFSRLIDILMTFPALLLAIVLTVILGKDINSLILAVGVVGVPLFARQSRAAAMVVREQPYVDAARSLGVHPIAILLRVVLPNCMTPILILSTLAVGTAILDVAALTFLGLAGQSDLPEWGLMLERTRNEFLTHPILVLAPGLAIFITVLGFNLLGDGLRDLLDPHDRRR